MSQSLTQSERFAVFAGAACIGGVMVFALSREMGWLDAGLARRAVGACLAMLWIILANILPKLGATLASERRAAARQAGAERWSAGLFVLSGLVVLAIWLFAPEERAVLASGLIGLAAFCLALALVLITRVRSGAETPGDPHET